MKTTIASCLLWVFFIQFAFSQNRENITGCDYVKTITSNLRMSFVGHEYNINKGDVEKLLLGDINAPVEFFFDPS